MITNILLTYYRVTTRHPLYAALTLLGLSFGIAVFVVVALFVRFESSFEAWLPNADQLYEVQTRWRQPGRPENLIDQTPGLLFDRLRQDYPDLVGTRLWWVDATLHTGGDVAREREQLVDPDFFKLFDLDLVAGDKATALQPGRILLTEAMARKYLARGQGVGATIRLTDQEGDRNYIVSAILKDPPRNTDFSFDFVRLIVPGAVDSRIDWQQWGSIFLFTYLRFSDPAAIARQDEAFDGFADRHMGLNKAGAPMHETTSWRLRSVRGAHLRDPQSRQGLRTLELVGILSLAVAAINFVNLATARGGMRAKEVAVRRSLGATRRTLQGQFLAEAVLTTFLAWLGALSLVEISLPIINAAGELGLTLNYRDDGLFLLALMGVLLLFGLAAGLYPALVLSSFQPAQVLAASRTPSGGRSGARVRESLVLLQFVVVIVFFVMTWGFVRQLDHMKTADLGFRHEGLLMTGSTHESRMTPALVRAIWAAFGQVPGVEAVGAGASAPGVDDFNFHWTVTSPLHAEQEVDILHTEIEPTFFQTYEATLLAGRFLDREHADDQVSNLAGSAPVNIVINAKALRALGFRRPEEAIDQTLGNAKGAPLRIVGVVGDLRFRSPKKELAAIFYRLNSDQPDHQITAVRYSGVDEAEMRKRLAAAWRSVSPDIPLDLISADDNLGKYTRPDRNRTRLFAVGAGAAALIGGIGLYGMAAFSTSRRLLEMAVRKVLGASRGAIVRLLVGQFMRPVLLANVIAWPIGYGALGNWLTQFNDRIAIGLEPFLIAGGGAALVAVATVFALAVASANAPPGRALRDE
jgi:putative ABC transport system permease protein